MNEAPQKLRRRSSQSSSAVNLVCPACSATIKADSKWCPSCNFTGGDTIGIFSDSPPPLLPILDAVGIWKDADIRKIELARENLRRRFPQIQWRICAVDLPAETSLSLFGFWLLNVCPLDEKETPEDRAWTVLLLMDVGAGRAATVPGYSVESCLTEADWEKILGTMSTPWQSGKSTEAVVKFFKNSRIHLEAAWKRNSSRRNHR